MASSDVGETRFIIQMSCLHRVPFEIASLPHGHEVNINTNPYTISVPCQQCDHRKQLARFKVVRKMAVYVHVFQAALRDVVDLFLRAWTTPGTRPHIFMVYRTVYRWLSEILDTSLRNLNRNFKAWAKRYHRFQQRWYARHDLRPDVLDDFGLFGAATLSPRGRGLRGRGRVDMGVDTLEGFEADEEEYDDDAEGEWEGEEAAPGDREWLAGLYW